MNDPFLQHSLAVNCLKAASEGRLEDLREAITDGADIEYERIGLNPLQSALSGVEPHWDCVNLLLESGANVNVKNRQRWSLLHQAAAAGWSDFAQRLIDKSAMAWVSDLHGITPLHVAAENGHNDIAKILLTGEVFDTLNINALDVDDETPLMKASRAGHLGMAQILVAKGADFELKNSQGQTAKDLADPHPDLADWLSEQVSKPKAIEVQEDSVSDNQGFDNNHQNDEEEVVQAPQKPKLSSISKRKLG